MRAATAGKLLMFLSLAAATTVAAMLVRDELRDLRRQYDDLKSNISTPVPPPAAPRVAPLPSVRAVPEPREGTLPPGDRSRRSSAG